MSDQTKRATPTGGSSRRDFLKTTAAAAGIAGLGGGGFWVTGTQTWADELKSKSPNERIGLASIGIGGKGESDSTQAAKHADLTAICDVDEKRLADFGAKHPKAKKFTDFRKMFDEMGKDFDAVTVSTPDHTHTVATMRALGEKKHVYTQKPLTHDVWEARLLRETAKKAGVATQMGNQGTAGNRFREGVEAIRAGAIGAIKEVHIWTNRPVWPQSPAIKARPEAAETPTELQWDLWLGPAKDRPYAKKFYHPFNWRGFWDFGTGALGDMGCHTANLPFMALKLGYPTSIQGSSEELNPETYPAWGQVTYDFPARGDMPPVKVMWYEGRRDGKLVHPPEDLVAKVLKDQKPQKDKKGKEQTVKLNDSGSIFVGEKGLIYSPHDYGGDWQLLPADDFKDFKAPSPTIARNPTGDDEGQKIEWLAAARGGPAAMSNFDYAGPLTEFILLGNVAILHGGKKLEWDGPGMRFPNAPEADKALRSQYRAGWELKGIA